MKMGTDMEAIERIKGYCCEVTQEQWEELVRVADEVGVKVGDVSRAAGMIKPDRFARYNDLVEVLGVYPDKYNYQEAIPFPDFLAKLRGSEEWQPKAGEMVEVRFHNDMEIWELGRFIGKDFDNALYACMALARGEYHTFNDEAIRPLRPTITRAEAEAKLNARIID